VSEYRYRCGHCGRYCSWDADSYTSFGCANPEAPEPYDPVYLCQRHSDELAEELLDRVLRNGIPPSEFRPFWQSPRGWGRALGIARGLWKHGLAHRPVKHTRARIDWREQPGMVGWCTCGWRSEQFPRGHWGKANDAIMAHIRSLREMAVAA
jgi:hypothetical protein